MKKFLSLVLALIMAMSLVTVSAGAVEYEDLTDLDEITYDEAVAVLNKIGVITGYEDGRFGPKSLLTRQAAAKIIVSLLIGPEAAQNLTAAVAPYPDVPTSSQFAGYISYCKTANIISGYSDGTFKPEGSLTGYAFSKMLLGALGYRSDIEGFTGTGWTMNVARIGNAANLFDRLQFQGGDAVDRETACQLALNTLKATMVEYTGGFNITTGDAVVTGAMTRSYVTSNQDYSKNIDRRRVTDAGNNANGTTNHFTVEFGEEHFKDLRMNEEGSWIDDFGRPSNHWSWKKVTIGVFPVEADFVYTEQMATLHSTPSAATKLRALGLNGYKVSEDTAVYCNGVLYTIDDVADIADLTDNGTVVEVYVDENIADWISHVVMIQTQLMEVKKVASDSVSLKLYDDSGADTRRAGFNVDPLDVAVEAVEEDDDLFGFFSGLKAGDYVAVVPVSTDRNGDSYIVGAAYKPETITGALTGSSTYANAQIEDTSRSVVEVTVGGTTYKVANWNKKLNNINRDILKVTTKDVTLYLDEFGNALLAKDVGSTNNYMILGAWRAQVVNGIIVTVAEGWNIDGNPVSLNIGAQNSTVAGDAVALWGPGDVLHYTNAGTSTTADWVVNKYGVYNLPGNDPDTEPTTYAIRSSNSSVQLDGTRYTGETKPQLRDDGIIEDGKPLINKSIKTIYVSFLDGEVDYIEVKDGLQNIQKSELANTSDLNLKPGARQAEATLSLSSSELITNTSDVNAIIIKKESNDASLKNLGYVYDYTTTNEKDENGNIITDYRLLTQDGEDVRMKSTDGVGNRVFVRFTELEDGMYRLKKFGYRIGSGTSAIEGAVLRSTVTKNQKSNTLYLLKMPGVKTMSTTTTSSDDSFIFTSGYPNSTELTVGDSYNGLVNLKGAKILDLRTNVANKDKIDTLDALKALITDDDGPNDYADGKFGNHVTVDIAFNDNPSSDDFRLVYYIILRGTAAKNTVDPWIYAEAEPDDDDDDDTVSDVILANSADKYLLPNLKGTLERRIDGVHALNITFDTPDWAGGPGDDWNEGAGDLTFLAELWIDGKLAKAVPFASVVDGGDTTGSGNIRVTNHTNAKATKFEVVGNWVDSDNTGGDSPFGDLTVAQSTAENVEVRISNIIWTNIGIKYVKASNTSTVLVPDAGATETIPYIKSASTAVAATLDVGLSDKYNNPAGEYTIKNARDTVNATKTTGTTLVTGSSANLGNGASSLWRALTQDWVVIEVSDVTDAAVTSYKISDGEEDLNPSNGHYLITDAYGNAPTVDKIGSGDTQLSSDYNADKFWITGPSSASGKIDSINPGSQVTLVLHIGAAADGTAASLGVEGYRVTLVIRDADTKKEVRPDNGYVRNLLLTKDVGVYSVLFNELNQNLYIDPEEVVLVPVEEYDLSDTYTPVYDKADTVTIYFDQDVVLTKAAAAKIASADASKAVVTKVRTGTGEETGTTNCIKVTVANVTADFVITIPDELLSVNNTGYAHTGVKVTIDDGNVIADG